MVICWLHKIILVRDRCNQRKLQVYFFCCSRKVDPEMGSMIETLVCIQ